ncbi:S-layer homology domain-containing protein [Synechocystis sp. LKSZ1]|uniref:S-layer homology domain-containing protein n=1 Tax=Synechocystis sp. LKSZ1 TaxID=3144951 RepID=UPI00336BC1D0
MIKLSRFGLLLIGSASLLSSCRGADNLQNRLAANPSLGGTPTPSLTVSPSPSPISSPLPSTGASPVPFPSPSPAGQVDLTGLPESFQRYIQDLQALDIVTEQSAPNFQANSPVRRRDFARWLFLANNRFFLNVSSKQIRPAQANAAPVFTDVPQADPDFTIIQGLAEAGLIPSSLTNDPSATLFRPNAPLTREDLILWKVPLDQRRSLPNASLDNIKETWGFQDAAKIDPKVWRALYGDYQNGEQANLRRMLGFTTLFQPKKAVTQAEATAALWYFGSQGEGLNATEALKLQAQSAPSPETTAVPSPGSP